jgi:hypothetical protein
MARLEDQDDGLIFSVVLAEWEQHKCEQAPAQLCVRVRKAESDGNEPARFKVRVRGAEELGSEGMLGLPRRGGVGLQAQVGDEGRKEEGPPKKFRVKMRRRSFCEGTELRK